MIDKVFRYGFFILLAITVVVYTFKGRGDKAYIDQLEDKVEKLEEEYREISIRNSSLEGSISSLKDTLEIVGLQVSETEKKRLEAIKYYEKKLKDIGSLTTVELDSFFTERYGHLLRGNPEGGSQ